MRELFCSKETLTSHNYLTHQTRYQHIRTKNYSFSIRWLLYIQGVNDPTDKILYKISKPFLNITTIFQTTFLSKIIIFLKFLLFTKFHTGATVLHWWTKCAVGIRVAKHEHCTRPLRTTESALFKQRLKAGHQSQFNFAQILFRKIWEFIVNPDNFNRDNGYLFHNTITLLWSVVFFSFMSAATAVVLLKISYVSEDESSSRSKFYWFLY